MNIYYTYVRRRATDNSIFYVGKGKNKRAWGTQGRSPYWWNIVNKHGYTIELIAQNLSEESAFELEVLLIAEIGRASLCNLTDGGDGMSGHTHTEVAKRRMSEACLGRSLSEEHKKKVGDATRGRITSEETKKKLSEAHRHRIFTAEHLQRLKTSSAKKAVVNSKGGQFLSMQEAAHWLKANGWPKANHSKISECCNGTRKTAYSFTWHFAALTTQENS